jgi:hypothetical protein
MRFYPVFPVVMALYCLMAPASLRAYRPFESTDAAVAETSKLEVEFGYLEFANDDGRNSLAEPSLRLNYGIAERFEISFEGALQVFESHSGHDLQLLDPEFSLKCVLLEGPLQDAPSPVGVAVEFGLLFPETTEDSTWGFESVLIASWRLREFTFHLNGGAEWPREEQDPALVWGLIVERPITKDLRGAVEVNGEAAEGRTAVVSALAGLIWEHDKIAYDAGIRFGLNDAAADIALTAGLTFKL